MRLSPDTPATAMAQWPTYDPESRGVGILHLGLGAFARAHICAYTEAALQAEEGDWRILGASLRGTEVAESLNPQGGRYTLLTRAAETTAQVIGALAGVMAGPQVGEGILAAIAAPGTRIVSLTVTEKGYGLRRDGGCDLTHPAVIADLAAPEAPQGVLGLLALGLKRRFAAGHGPLTLLSCDNLPDNGRLLRKALIDFAARAHGPELAALIAANVSFPSAMVDRITPRSTEATLADAARLTGAEDLAAVETEPFAQWVIEDDFAAGRPAWEKAGATFTSDVHAFEAMKLRMLNGSHSMIAYCGALAGCDYVRDVMADADLKPLVERHLAAAAATLKPGVSDYAAYAKALVARFENPAIAHATRQIAMDGSQKMQQRIFLAALDAQGQGLDLTAFAFATAAWMRFTLGRDEAGAAYPLNDPREAEISAAVAGKAGAEALFDALAALPDLLPTELSSGAFRDLTIARLDGMLSLGMRAALARELA